MAIAIRATQHRAKFLHPARVREHKERNLPKLNIPVTDAFATALRDAARSAGYKSTAEYVRVVLAERMQVEHLAAAWGGKRQDEQLEVAMQSQDAQVVQVTHLEAPASLPVGQDAQLAFDEQNKRAQERYKSDTGQDASLDKAKVTSPTPLPPGYGPRQHTSVFSATVRPIPAFTGRKSE